MFFSPGRSLQSPGSSSDDPEPGTGRFLRSQSQSFHGTNGHNTPNRAAIPNSATIANFNTTNTPSLPARAQNDLNVSRRRRSKQPNSETSTNPESGRARTSRLANPSDLPQGYG